MTSSGNYTVEIHINAYFYGVLLARNVQVNQQVLIQQTGGPTVHCTCQIITSASLLKRKGYFSCKDQHGQNRTVSTRSEKSVKRSSALPLELLLRITQRKKSRVPNQQRLFQLSMHKTRGPHFYPPW